MPHTLHLSTVTLAEIRYGIERQQDAALLIEWRRMVQSGRAQGIVFSHPDVFMAATARVHGLVVCTRDAQGFQDAGVSLLNPWQAAGQASATC